MGIFGGSPDAEFDGFELRTKAKTITKTRGSSKGKHQLTGATAAVETGEELFHRATSTPLLVAGEFAFTLKHETGGSSFMTIEGPGFAWVTEVDREMKGKAVEFAAKLRAAASVAERREPLADHRHVQPRLST